MSVSLSNRVMEQPLEVVDQNQEVAEHCLRKWTVDHKEISIFKKGNEYTLVIYNGTQEERCSLGLNEEEISALLKTQPVLLENGEFYLNLEDQPEEFRISPNNLVRFFKNPHPIWQLFNESTQRATQFPVLNREITLIDPFSHIPPELFKSVKEISRIDKKTIIDANNWAVSLISARGPLGHAMLAIEGIRGTSYPIPFLEYIHLTNSGQTEVKREVFNIHRENEVLFSGKTETWLRSKEKVQKIFDLVDWQIKKQKNGKPIIFFHLLGGDSKLAKYVKAREFNNWKECCDYFEEAPELEDKMKLHCNTILSQLKKNTGKIYLTPSKSIILEYSKKKDGFYSDLNDIGKTKMFVNPDNCITYSRTLLGLTGVYLNTHDLERKGYEHQLTTPAQYIRFNDFSKAPDGQERVRVLFSTKEGYWFQVDLTEEIQKKVGNHSWKLTQDSLKSIEEQWKAIEEKGESAVQKIEDVTDGNKKIEISVEVDNETRTFDLSRECKVGFGNLKENKKMETLYQGDIYERSVAMMGFRDIVRWKQKYKFDFVVIGAELVLVANSIFGILETFSRGSAAAVIGNPLSKLIAKSVTKNDEEARKSYKELRKKLYLDTKICLEATVQSYLSNAITNPVEWIIYGNHDYSQYWGKISGIKLEDSELFAKLAEQQPSLKIEESSSNGKEESQ
ncbi:MAG: hypothetical protein K1000chlam3_00858 [Chlamydiae bacterium]|nr:hypothetical protein [Chlamydiota bacterium]